jgi:transcriptional regulator with XRE-family HTH domain
MMTFPEWITRKYLDWRGDVVTGRSITKFAEYLGVSQSLMNNWMQGQRMPGRKSLMKIGRKYPEIIEIFEFAIPNNYDELDNLPLPLRNRLRSAVHEVNRMMEQRDIDGDDPEAETLTIQIFGKWGFKYVSTETVPDTE